MSNGTVEDRLAVRELIERYCEGVNQRDAQIWGSTWAEDSEWNLPVVPGMEAVKGRANIVQAWVDSMKLFPFVNMMSMPTSMTFDGDRARIRSYTSEVAEMQDGTVICPRGQYDDEVVRQDGRWLFARRSFKPLHGE
ncbi:MAG: nuclear transport factor 2 family protein [Alphaproteobacteria bacterium]|nr:nuclear transport factor 2 family protein [Alphaproteobacteria bacterium]